MLPSTPKILAVGRNYLAHIHELGNQIPKDLFFFLKAPSSIIYPTSKPLLLPQTAGEVHYETEIGFYISKKGKNISIENALEHIDSYCLALDLTCRTLQSKAKKSSLPWSQSKSLDGFLPMTYPFDLQLALETSLSKSELEQCALSLQKGHILPGGALQIQSKVNNKLVQDGSTDLMIHDIPQIIHKISQDLTLYPGDLILTGTPAGVGQILPGDTIEIILREPIFDKILTRAAWNIFKD